MRTRPREHRRRAAFAAVSVACALAGCSYEAPLGLVTGTVVDAPVVLTSVAAFSVDELAAAGPIDADGSFVIAVPPTALLELTFVDVDGTPHGMDQVFEVCSTDTTLALGAISTLPDAARCPPVPREACTQAQDFLERCMTDTALVCDNLQNQLFDCHAGEDTSCGPLRDALDTCAAMALPCEAEHEALSNCEAMYDCASIAQMIGERCGDPCASERAYHEDVCLAPPPPCGPGFVFVAELSVSPGCQMAEPPR